MKCLNKEKILNDYDGEFRPENTTPFVFWYMLGSSLFYLAFHTSTYSQRGCIQRN